MCDDQSMIPNGSYIANECSSESASAPRDLLCFAKILPSLLLTNTVGKYHQNLKGTSKTTYFAPALSEDKMLQIQRDILFNPVVSDNATKRGV